MPYDTHTIDIAADSGICAARWRGDARNLALATRTYVPGLITNILLLPATITGLMFIIHSHPLTVIAICSVCGIAVMAINLRIAHHLGTKFHIK